MAPIEIRNVGSAAATNLTVELPPDPLLVLVGAVDPDIPVAGVLLEMCSSLFGTVLNIVLVRGSRRQTGIVRVPRQPEVGSSSQLQLGWAPGRTQELETFQGTLVVRSSTDNSVWVRISYTVAVVSTGVTNVSVYAPRSSCDAAFQ